MKTTRLAALPVLLLLAACAGVEERPDASHSNRLGPHVGADAVSVAEAFMTPPMRDHEIDSVAAWIAPSGESWLVATGKESNQLVVYDGDTGALRRTVGGPGSAPGQFMRPNGIAVYADLVFVVERDNHRVQVLQLPDFAPLAVFGADELKSPYGLWLREIAPGELELFVTDSFMADYRTETVPPLDQLDQRVKRYTVRTDGPVPVATLRQHFGDTSEEGALRMVESIAGDPAHDRLLIAEEDVRVGTTLREYRMDGTYTGFNLPRERFQAQAEGVALWACSDGSGYWIAADQSSDHTVFHLFDRQDLRHLGSFAGHTVALTDGIWLQPAGTARFPNGVLYAAHDDQGAGAFDWRDIAKALNLRIDCGL
jgi:3-phytase